jgi:glycine/D-amino acid oxidase-like deaminating enzyme
MERGYFYFRPIDGRVLIGGGRHLDPETEATSVQEVNPLIKERLLGLLREEILDGQPFDISYEWTGFLGVGKERAAIVKQVSDRVRCGVRMGGMGVAIGSRIGRKMAYL